MSTADAPTLVEVTSCQVCGGDRPTLMFEEPPFRVLRCTDCTLVYVSPRVHSDQLPDVYGERYWRSDSPRTRGYADYVAEEPLYLKTFRRRLRLVRRFVAPGARVLDVGCAAGFFLRVMQENGHDVWGIELSAAIAGHAADRVGGDRVHVGPIRTVPEDHPGIRPGSFDLVTLWDVVEHVEQPQELLRSARALLRPDGILILETQNVDSLFAGLLGRRWQHYKHHEHLFHFNPATIAKLLAQCGFVVLRNSPAYGGKYVSFGFIAERAARLGRLGALLRPLGLLGAANVYVNFRDEMVVVARPRPTNGRG